MASTIVTTLSLGLILVVLASILKTVHGGERFQFVGGVVLILAGSGLVAAGVLPEVVGGLVSLLGVLGVLWSTVPLLRQSPTTA